MSRETDRATALEALREGKTPENGALLRDITAGTDSLTDFLTRIYLEDYIPSGGSKIKFVTGNAGSGKTHFSQLMCREAEKRNYRTVRFSAKDIWLNDFREIYLEIIRQCDLEEILKGCAEKMIRDMGYAPADIREGQNFMDMLSERGEGDALTRNEIRGQLRTWFTRNPLLDNTFAACCSLLTGGILGHPVLEKANADLILAYMRGDKTVKTAQLKAIGLVPSPITKMNARHLLRSLCEVIHLSGSGGLMVIIDDMEMLLNRNTADPIRYTKLRREDTYESIRQLIDDIDSMRYVLFMMCFDRELMDDESLGMKSYQVLWFRIQNEVVSSRFNRFADILDMDRYGDEAYDAETLCEMSEKLASVMREAGIPASPLDREEAENLRARSVFGRLGLPYLMNRMTLEGGREHE